MPRYDETFALLGGRVLREAVIDLETVVQRLASIGASVDAIAKALEDDLVNEGPIFNKFLRNLSGAASASVMGAVRQGEAVGLVRGNRFLQRAVANLGLEDSYIRAVEDADPEAAAEIEQQVVADQPFRWG
ncbi:MAG TPA: hypothetical protein VJ787_13040, partial [Thermoleophilia bacterium]|nr:hypothetical protein [Thermoleophilia bacterium]